jgi:hypothetical protein
MCSFPHWCTNILYKIQVEYVLLKNGYKKHLEKMAVQAFKSALIGMIFYH